MKETIVFTCVSNIFVPGSTESIFDGPKFKFHVLAVRRPEAKFLFRSYV